MLAELTSQGDNSFNLGTGLITRYSLGLATITLVLVVGEQRSSERCRKRWRRARTCSAWTSWKRVCERRLRRDDSHSKTNYERLKACSTRYHSAPPPHLALQLTLQLTLQRSFKVAWIMAWDSEILSPEYGCGSVDWERLSDQTWAPGALDLCRFYSGSAVERRVAFLASLWLPFAHALDSLRGAAFPFHLHCQLGFLIDSPAPQLPQEEEFTALLTTRKHRLLQLQDTLQELLASPFKTPQNTPPLQTNTHGLTNGNTDTSPENGLSDLCHRCLECFVFLEFEASLFSGRVV